MLLLVALAVSLDSLTVGITFGLRRVRLGGLTLLILAGVSMLTVLVGGLLGGLVAGWLGPALARRLGAGGLALLGILLLGQALWEVEPTLVDRDCSGSVEPGEAILLGTVLAADAAAAGMATALVGGGLYVLAGVVGLLSGLLFAAGYWLGGAGRLQLGRGWWRLAPGGVLLVIGVLRMLAG